MIKIELYKHEIQPEPVGIRAVCFGNVWKTAALLFEKVYVLDLACGKKANGRFYLTSYDKETLWDLPGIIPGGVFMPEIDDEEALEALGVRRVAEDFWKYEIQAMPLYRSGSAFSSEFETGDVLVYQAVLDYVPLVDDKRIAREQILEFRKDKRARDQYRKLRAWLADALKGRTLDEALNLIGQKLDDYEWAIEKHGLETKIGALKSVIDSNYLAKLAAGAGVAGIFGGPVWAALAGGSLILSKMSLYIAERKLDLEDIKRKSEVALIHEIRKKFGKPKKAKGLGD